MRLPGPTRPLDSTGQTIDFLLTAKRDTAAAKRFLRKAIQASGNAMPRVLNVDKNPAYPAAVEALKAEGSVPRRVALRQCQYLNNVIEIVFTQMTKPNVLAARMGGNYVTDFDCAVGHKDAVD